ncbi:MAG: hypothetical protein Q4F76_05350, partial [Lachnospiraceae bacterium]|nr:hypothetical protein [Lachnospiraceae bacterium]
IPSVYRFSARKASYDISFTDLIFRSQRSGFHSFTFSGSSVTIAVNRSHKSRKPLQKILQMIYYSTRKEEAT